MRPSPSQNATATATALKGLRLSNFGWTSTDDTDPLAANAVTPRGTPVRIYYSKANGYWPILNHRQQGEWELSPYPTLRAAKAAILEAENARDAAATSDAASDLIDAALAAHAAALTTPTTTTTTTTMDPTTTTSPASADAIAAYDLKLAAIAEALAAALRPANQAVEDAWTAARVAQDAAWAAYQAAIRD